MECPLCLELLYLHPPATTQCGHTFHREPCLRDALAQSPLCPLCRARMPPDLPAVNVTLRDALALAQAARSARVPLRAVNPALLAVFPVPELGRGSYGACEIAPPFATPHRSLLLPPRPIIWRRSRLLRHVRGR